MSRNDFRAAFWWAKVAVVTIVGTTIALALFGFLYSFVSYK